VTAPARALATVAPDRLAVLAVALVVPWTVVPAGGAVSLVFPWGLVSAWPLPVVAVPLSRYLLSLTAGLPAYLRAWPLSVVLYACALASSSGFARRHVDADVTVALLAVAGAAHLLVSVGIWRTGRLALPAGTVVLWTLAYAVYRTDEGTVGSTAGRT
jgi:uncharacterized protein (TIGR04206 family)